MDTGDREELHRSAEDRRADLRAQYTAECLYVLAEIVPRLQQAASDHGVELAVAFDTNAAAAYLLIEAQKRRLL